MTSQGFPEKMKLKVLSHVKHKNGQYTKVFCAGWHVGALDIIPVILMLSVSILFFGIQVSLAQFIKLQ